MGTLVRIVLYADSRPAGEAAAAAAFARIAALDARLSDYRDDSEVAALSRAAAGVPVPLSDDLFAILEASEALARRTGGAFDVTAGRLTHLWRRARRLNAWPDAARVAAARAAGGVGQGAARSRAAARRRSPRPASRSMPAASPRATRPTRRCACCARAATAPRWSPSAATSPPAIRRPGAGLDGGHPAPAVAGAPEPTPHWIALCAPRSRRPATPSSG